MLVNRNNKVPLRRRRQLMRNQQGNTGLMRTSNVPKQNMFHPSNMMIRNGGLPDSIKVRLVYSVRNPVNATLTNFSFRGNDLFDPEVAIGGTQPAWYPELSVMWRKFVVISSNIEVSYVTTTAVGTNSGLLVVYACPVLGFTSPTSIYQAQDETRATSRYIANILGAPGIIHKTQETRPILHCNDLESDDTMWGNISASPTSQFFWNISIGALDQAGTCSGSLNVKLYYDAILFDRASLPDAT